MVVTNFCIRFENWARDENLSRQSVSRSHRKNRGCCEMPGHQFLEGENGSGQRNWNSVRI